ncbi:MAG: hypothetical protein PHC61_02745 [Chitinivibrionales bacterium]|nr:hypothetical protein [Chitinivibrionales bacterium]
MNKLALAVLILFGAFGTAPIQSATYNVSNAPFNAAGNGTTNDKAAIQMAIDSAAKYQGSTVLLTGKKIFYSGSIRLKSGVTLQIDSGSTLLGSTNVLTDYDLVRTVADGKISFVKFALL